MAWEAPLLPQTNRLAYVYKRRPAGGQGAVYSRISNDPVVMKQNSALCFYKTATASISTSPPLGNAATATQERAGKSLVNKVW